MPFIVLLLLVGGLGAIGALGLSVSRLRRRAEESRVVALPELRPAIRVLHDGDELRNAVCRAAQFERGIAQMAGTRAERYEALMEPAVITDIRAGRRLVPEDEIQVRPHSAELPCRVH